MILGARRPLGVAPALPVPWPETAISAVSSSAGTGTVELHCVHVPNAANGWVKVERWRRFVTGCQPPGGVRVCSAEI